MTKKAVSPKQSPSVMVLGVGAFAYGTAQILKDNGATVSTYLTRNYAHFSPSIAGPTYTWEQFPNPNTLIAENKINLVVPMSIDWESINSFAQGANAQSINLVVPMSIDWALAPWAKELIDSKVPVFGPTGEGMKIERERDFARKLCHQFKIPFPKAYVASNRLEAEAILEKHPHPYVIKNPLCSPTSPIHTILCETIEDTRSWLKNIDYAEGVFLQEYLGRAEAGHIALISHGQIYSLVTNQEYKRAFNGNMGVVAGAPLGGLIERDPEDKYGLARELIHPLLPWFREVNYHGPIQVTAVRRDNKWHVIEYNIRIGVMSGAMILRMLENPVEVLLGTARNERLEIRFKPDSNFGCSITLAGYGYPYVQLSGPSVPIEVTGKFDCDVWWNEVIADHHGKLFGAGHRICDVIALSPSLEEAIQKAYANIQKIRCLGSYFRTDIGQSLWPPGTI